MTPTIKNIPIAKIRRDSGAQFRTPLNKGGVEGKPWLSEQHVADIVEAIERGKELPPIITFFDGKEQWMADGDHRIEAFERVGSKSIRTEVHKGTRLESRRYGRKANSEHQGLKRNRGTKRAQAEDALRDPDWEDWSLNAIADYVDVGWDLVKSVAVEIGLTSVSGSEERTYTTKHGTTATMKTGNIGGGKPNNGANSNAAEEEADTTLNDSEDDTSTAQNTPASSLNGTSLMGDDTPPNDAPKDGDEQPQDAPESETEDAPENATPATPEPPATTQDEKSEDTLKNRVNNATVIHDTLTDKPKEADLSEDEWLQSLPIYRVLSQKQHKGIFVRKDLLAVRGLWKAKETFERAARKAFDFGAPQNTMAEVAIRGTATLPHGRDWQVHAPCKGNGCVRCGYAGYDTTGAGISPLRVESGEVSLS